MGNAALPNSIDRFVELTRLALAAEHPKSAVLRCVLGPSWLTYVFRKAELAPFSG